MNTSLKKAFKKTSKNNYWGYYYGYGIYTYRRPHGYWCCEILKISRAKGEYSTTAYREGYHGSSLRSIPAVKKWIKTILNKS